jgi:hypothetical protein
VSHGSAMRLPRAAFVGLFSVVGSGCFAIRPSAPDSFVHLAARNGVQQTIRPHDDNQFAHEIRKYAEATFAQRAGEVPGEAFHEGFVEGFVDYVEAGGTGEPPYLPPFRYRLTEHRTPEGQAAIRDWYAGFREGSAAAKASGLRELNYVPLPGPAAPVGDRHRDEALPPEINLVAPFAGDRSPWDLPGDLHRPRPAGPEVGPSPRPVPEPPKLPIVPLVPGPGSPGTRFTPPIDLSPTRAGS